MEEFTDGLEVEASNQSFTLDPLAQVEKLQAQKWPPSLWILKAVQAAVASQALNVAIRVRRSSIQVWFDPRVVSESVRTYCKQMVLAAQAVSARGLEVRWDGQSVENFERVGAGSVSLRLERPARSWWQWTDPVAADIHREIPLRCAFCPIPVQLDGRLVHCPFPERNAMLGAKVPNRGWTEGALPYSWLAESIWCDPERSDCLALAGPLSRRPFQCIFEGQVQVSWEFHEEHQVCARTKLTAPVALLEVSGDNANPRLLSSGFYPGVSAEVDCTKLVPLSYEIGVHSAGRSSTLFYKKFCYVEEERILLPEILVRDQEGVFQGAALAPYAWLGLATCEGVQGGLFYVSDGVLLNPIPLQGFEGTSALIACGELKTDLSLLSPVVDETIQADLEWVQVQENFLVEEASGLILQVAAGEKARIPVHTRQLWRLRLKSKKLGLQGSP
jgi:hypothetical protein